jgi:hypothetical protein
MMKTSGIVTRRKCVDSCHARDHVLRPHSDPRERPLSVEYTIEFGAEPALDVNISTHGAADVAAFARLDEDLVSDTRFVPGMFVLIDNSKLDTTNLQLEEIRAIAGHFEKLGDRIGQTTIAIVAGSAATYGQLRQLVALASATLARVSVFTSGEEAVAWLRREHELDLRHD